MKKGLKNIIESAYPDFTPVTNATKRINEKNSSRFRGSVRMSTGRFYTDADYEAKRKIILSTPLP